MDGVACVIHEGPYCAGCWARLTSDNQLAHEATCFSFRDYLIAQKLAAQARDDGRDDDAEELLAEYPI
jgi:hypothetical protein